MQCKSGNNGQVKTILYFALCGTVNYFLHKELSFLLPQPTDYKSAGAEA